MARIVQIHQPFAQLSQRRLAPIHGDQDIPKRGRGLDPPGDVAPEVGRGQRILVHIHETEDRARVLSPRHRAQRGPQVPAHPRRVRAIGGAQEFDDGAGRVHRRASGGVQ